MKRLFAILLALICLSLCAYCAETADGTEYTPALFYGFDDGKVPSSFVKKDLNLLSGQTDYVIDGIFSACSKTSDPYFTYNADFDYGEYSEFKIRMKHKATDSAAVKCNLQVFLKGTKADGTAFGFAQTYSMLQSIGLDSGDEFVEYTLPLNSIAELEGAHVSSLRIDMISVIGEMYIDYIMFVPANLNDDIVYTFDNGLSPWGKNGGVTITENNGIITGVTNATNGLISNSKHKFLGADYPKVYVRMMIDKEVQKGATGNDAIPGIPSGTRKSLFYTNLVDAEGNTLKGLYTPYNGYTYASNVVSAADNGKYKVYTYDFSGYDAYLNNYVTSMAFNVIEAKDLRFNVDTILFKNPKSLNWTFECDGLLEGWTASDNCFSVEDGVLKYTENDASYSNPRIVLSGLNISADNYVGFEVVMKHKLASKPSTNMLLYYTGTDKNGTAFSANDAYTAKAILSSNNSGDNYVYYYLDLTSAEKWNGSQISSLRFDPINELGDFEVESIRLVPAAVFEPLDKDKMSLEYEFSNNERGSADGKITVNFAGQNPDNAKRINLYWASGNDTDGYKQLTDYTVLESQEGKFFAKDYIIDKDLLIPEEATALAVSVTDSEKVFQLVYKLPEEKIPAPYGTPLYTASFSSDFHLGGWGSNPNPNVRQAAARNEIMAKGVDFLVVAGDICQWYGEIANQDEWRFATEYFKAFGIPVYMVKGNHDEPNYPSGYVAGKGYENFSYDFFDAYLDNWLAYSKEQNYYTAERTGEKLDYYHTEINGHHYIFLAIPDSGYYAFGDKQLEWLDKTLYEAEESGKPIFVFGHVPANGKVNYQIALGKGSMEDFDKLEPILNRHPTAIYISGDSHYTLDSVLKNTVDGKQIRPSYINDGAVIEAYKAVDERVTDSSRQPVPGNNSHGLFVEVYKDKMIVRARDYMNGKYISLGLSKVTFREECTIPEISVVKKETSQGTLLKANSVTDASYTWILNGTQSDVTTDSITLPADYEGYIALRITDAKGAYRSELFESIGEISSESAELYDITFDSDKSTATVTFSPDEKLIGANAVIAYYDGKVLSGIKLHTVTAEQAIAGSFTAEEITASGTKAKVFIFSSLDKMMPMCKVLEKDISVDGN